LRVLSAEKTGIWFSRNPSSGRSREKMKEHVEKTLQTRGQLDPFSQSHDGFLMEHTY
jgi:hypothetical protein